MATNLGSGDGGATNVSSSHSAAITIPSGTDLIVVLAQRTIFDANSPIAPTSATLNGVAMTAVPQTPIADQNTSWIKMYFMLSPPTGSQTVVVSGGGGVAFETGFTWSAYSGFQQSGQPDSSNKTDQANTGAMALQTTVVAANSWVIGGYGSQNSITSVTNGVERVNAFPNGYMGIVDSNGPVAAGSYTITVNDTTAQLMNGLVASFSPATTNTVTFTSRLSLMKVG